MVIIVFDSWANDSIEDATTRPSSWALIRAWSFKSKTWTLLDFARFNAMGSPMFPRPKKPIVGVVVALAENNRERTKCCCNATRALRIIVKREKGERDQKSGQTKWKQSGEKLWVWHCWCWCRCHRNANHVVKGSSDFTLRFSSAGGQAYPLNRLTRLIVRPHQLFDLSQWGMRCQKTHDSYEYKLQPDLSLFTNHSTDWNLQSLKSLLASYYFCFVIFCYFIQFPNDAQCRPSLVIVPRPHSRGKSWCSTFFQYMDDLQS